ncbi:type II secretion system F family protein [Pantoea ananatis]|uniref:type II secretion system F family protein n=1 Tax=Pantoea ananas TaxID=553 RepID=UPI003FA49EB9
MSELKRVIQKYLKGHLHKGQKHSDGLGRWIGQKTFNTSDRTTLYEDLAFLLENNQKVGDAIAGMQRSRRRKNDPQLLCLNDIKTALDRGKGIDAGLEGWAPRQETMILRSGRVAKDLKGALHRAIFVVKGLGEMKWAAISNLSYPLLLLGSNFYMMKMVNDRFLPQLERMVPVENWTGSLWWLGTITHFFVDNRYWLVLGATGLFFWIIWSLPRLTGHVRRQVLDRLFPWSLYREMQGVSFLLNLSALLRAQVRTDQALDMLSQNASPWLYERLIATKRQVARGKHLGLALADNGYVFPSRDAIDRLSILTATTGGEDNIENFARMWLTKTINKIKRTTWIIQVAVMLITAGYLLLTFAATQDLGSLIGNH